MIQFGFHLRRLREQSGLSQKAMADAAGVPQASISNWEQGRTIPGWDSVLKLAAALGVSCEEFNKPVPAESDPPARKPGRPKKSDPS